MRKNEQIIITQNDGRMIKMKEDRIYGIKCGVSSCEYNKNDCECVAGKIDVCCCGCQDAECSAQTECKTFKPKK